MKDCLRTATVVLFALFATVASAHPNHADAGPPISRDELPAMSQRVVMLLIEAKQLAPSWRGMPAKEIASRQAPEGPIWVVRVENPAEADKAKRSVFIFFDEFGQFLGGNHTGRLQ